jgi:methylated-DNA-[protein]-cysteine S-methyltransferase
MGRGTLQTPLGPLTVISHEGAVTDVEWRNADPDPAPEILNALDQLKAYFDGTLTRFDLPLDVRGSAFQRDVCNAIAAIPFGETRSYGDLAHALAAPAQAIGAACGGNPIPVIIPCHRVLGANSLGGYSGAGGIETKVWLLRHEKAGGLLI